MDVFQSPAEALAFNYVSFGLFLPTSVQSLLTCVAIVTAAVSFWRIRAVSSANSLLRIKSLSSADHSSPPLLDESLSTPYVYPALLPISTLSETVPEKEKEKQIHQEEEEKACSSLVGVGVGGIDYGKEKFTMYYDDEEEKDEEEMDATISSQEEEDPIPPIHADDVVCYYREEAFCSDEVWSSGDGIWVGRGGDLGWYRSQDLTVFNGNVVRLWDCQRRRCLSPPPPTGCFPRSLK